MLRDEDGGTSFYIASYFHLHKAKIKSFFVIPLVSTDSLCIGRYATPGGFDSDSDSEPMFFFFFFWSKQDQEPRRGMYIHLERIAL
jgi:hypothetical protein